MMDSTSWFEIIITRMSLQCSNDSVLGAVFHPTDANLIVTCGKSHINFWTMEGNTLSKRQGLFEVRDRYNTTDNLKSIF